jgi:methyl-accepting chemotaxis protein
MQLKMREQLAGIVAFPIGSLAIMAVVLWQQLGVLEESQSRLTQLTKVRLVAGDVIAQEYRNRWATRGVVLTHNPRQRVVLRESAEAMVADLSALSSAETLAPGIAEQVALATPAVLTIIGNNNQIAAGVIANRQGVIDGYLSNYSGASGDFARSIDAKNQANTAAGNILDPASARIVALTADAATSYAAIAAAPFLRARVILGVTLALAVLLTAGIAFAYNRRLSRRLGTVTLALDGVVREDFTALVAACRRIAAGDLRSSFASQRSALPAHGRDEIGDVARRYNDLAGGLGTIAQEFAAMVAKLDSLIGGVTGTSVNLASASDHVSLNAGESREAVNNISTAIDTVAAGARDQAAGITQSKAAIEELARAAVAIAGGAADQTRSVASATNAVGKLDAEIVAVAEYGRSLALRAEHATKEAGLGIHAVKETAASLGHLRDASLAVGTAMSTLENRSAEVGDIVSVIEEIADQTNLLALNAAIEAARAGEHGRGFAVVADEVRKLAERSSSSTREIAGILGAIRKETVSAADAMRASEKIMERGIALARDATRALDSVAQAIDDTARVAADVAGRTGIMQTASATLAGEMANVSRIVEKNAGSAQTMQTTTGSVLAAIAPIAETALAQAQTADAVSAATAQLAAQVRQMETTAADLREQANRLNGLVGMFNVSGIELAAAGGCEMQLAGGRA